MFFHTLRHWKATMEYHYTKDILHVNVPDRSIRSGKLMKLGENDEVSLKSYYLWDEPYFDKLLEESKQLYQK
jgi:hypothetical protein